MTVGSGVTLKQYRWEEEKKKKTKHYPKVVRFSQLYIQEAVLIRSFSREELKDFANTDGNRF